MIITYKDFPRLKFPLYVLPSDNWYAADGILFLDEMVVDDKKMPGKTLGIRRLQSGRKDLLPIKKAVLDLSDLTSCKGKFFIDSNGKPFIYQKTFNSKLICYKIKRIELKGEKSVLWVHNWPSPFTIDRPPAGKPEFVRLLHISGAPWIIYDYVRAPVKATYRRV